MRNKLHNEQIKRWAKYVRNNPKWKKELALFLDSQIIMAERIYSKLSKTKKGKEKILQLKGLKN